MPGLEEWPSPGFGRGQNSAYRSAGYCALLLASSGKEGFKFVDPMARVPHVRAVRFGANVGQIAARRAPPLP